MSSENFATMTRLEIESICQTKKSQRELGGPCPRCGSKTRLAWWPEGGSHWDFFCFDCELHGFVVDANGHSPRFDPKWREEWNRKRQAEKARGARERKVWAAQLNAKALHLQYHENLNGHSQTIKKWYGLTQETIQSRKLGYCDTCPTFWSSDSLTIPWFQDGKVIEIRHRLLKPEPGKGKYRTQKAGPFNGVFNLDTLKGLDGWAVLTEGEFKAITLEQFGIRATAVPGITCFQPEWASKYSHVQGVYVVFDPGQAAREWAAKTASMLVQAGIEVIIVDVPDKPDDLLVKHGWSADLLNDYMKTGRRVHA